MTEDGQKPYSDWLKGLKDVRAKAKITAAIHKMRQGNFGDHKGVGEGVMEYRLFYGPGYRIYYGLDGETLVILLFGGTKERQGNDIDAAKKYWADYQRRKEALL
ncbi:hypothetical protein K6T12_21215 [Marinobacterium sp. CAU 1594]|nr:hypothetical protein [Marinobacterium arenosum]